VSIVGCIVACLARKELAESFDESWEPLSKNQYLAQSKRTSSPLLQFHFIIADRRISRLQSTRQRFTDRTGTNFHRSGNQNSRVLDTIVEELWGYLVEGENEER